MAFDGYSQSNHAFGWPGDLVTRTDNGRLTGVNDYIARLVLYDYLDIHTVKKLCQVPGLPPFEGQDIKLFDAAAHFPFKIFQVHEKDDNSTIFLTTRTYSYNEELMPTFPRLFKDNGFIIVHKMGDGTHFGAKQARSIQSLGLLPGRRDFQDRPQETAADVLPFR